MNYVVRVQVCNCTECLCKKLEGLGLSKNIFAILKIKQIAHFRILHNHVNVLVVIKCIPNFD